MIMDKCRISIIVPIFNAEDYISRCLDSILEQSFTSYEVLLVDDGSTDATLHELHKLHKQQAQNNGLVE